MLEVVEFNVKGSVTGEANELWNNGNYCTVLALGRIFHKNSNYYYHCTLCKGAFTKGEGEQKMQMEMVKVLGTLQLNRIIPSEFLPFRIGSFVTLFFVFDLLCPYFYVSLALQ